MLLVGAGITAWGKYLMPRGPFVEERHVLASAPEDARRVHERRSSSAARIAVRRRKVLGGLLGAGMGVFGIVAIFPLLRSLGPLPGDTLDDDELEGRGYLVDRRAGASSAGRLGVGSVAHGVPRGLQNTEEGQAVDQTILIRAAQDVPIKDQSWHARRDSSRTRSCARTRAARWASTSAQLQLLVCPCHQSMFDVVDHAPPRLRPRASAAAPAAARDRHGRLPLRARPAINQPVGPGFWERS